MQYALTMRVFSKLPVEEYLLEIVSKLRSGKLDDKLIYKKRLRKPVNEYTVNIPPHVQAAIALQKNTAHGTLCDNRKRTATNREPNLADRL